MQPRLLYPARLSFNIKGKIKSFPDKNGYRVHYRQTSIARNVKDTALTRRRNIERKEHRSKEKMSINKCLFIITLNINGLNAPIKRHRVAEWMRKHDTYIYCLKDTHLRTNNPIKKINKGPE